MDSGREAGLITMTAHGGTWVLIDVGDTPFTMGSSADELGHQPNEVEHDVTLTRNFWLMTTEITQQQFLDAMGYNPSNFRSCGMDCPVEQAKWHGVAAYTNVLSVLEGLGECYQCSGTPPDCICTSSASYGTPYDCPGYRLPTEAEWEYAARGGTTTATYAGDVTAVDCTDTTLDSIAWVSCNSNGRTHPVGTKSPNAYGLYDMLGNLWEWCHDWYRASHPGGSETDPAGPPSGSYRVLRGGSWDYGASEARAASRTDGNPIDASMSFTGRVSRSAP
jgi:formylglycine-generating enzyme required for sulfatase activity